MGTAGATFAWATWAMGRIPGYALDKKVLNTKIHLAMHMVCQSESLLQKVPADIFPLGHIEIIEIRQDSCDFLPCPAVKHRRAVLLALSRPTGRPTEEISRCWSFRNKP